MTKKREKKNERENEKDSKESEINRKTIAIFPTNKQRKRDKI
jgi:hypothetical protein